MYRVVMICCVLGLANSAVAQVCQSTIAASAPDARYQVVAGSQGAEVLDVYTNLIWQRCSVGQQWSGNACLGDAQSLTWVDALKQVSPPKSGWRVPNIRELSSLIEDACHDSSINHTIFPNTPAKVYWSSSPSTTNQRAAWSVDFNTGVSGTPQLKSLSSHLRLVRSASGVTR